MNWYKKVNDFFKINYEFYLDQRDIGKLVCVKLCEHYNNIYTEYDNSIILDLSYQNKNRKKRYNKTPVSVTILWNNKKVNINLTQNGYSDVRVKFY
jgi:hypothetical protein